MSQRGRYVTTYATYAREFSRLKRFASKLVNTYYTTTQWFVLGLDTKICNIVEAITPTTYAATFRAAKTMEEHDSARASSSMGQKRRHDQTDRNDSSSSQPQNDLTDSIVISGMDNRELKTGQTTDPSVRSVVRIIRSGSL